MLRKERAVVLNIHVGREAAKEMAVEVATELVRRGRKGHVSCETINAIAVKVAAVKVVKEMDLARIAINAMAAEVTEELVRIGFIKIVNVRSGVVILPAKEIDDAEDWE